jgi:C1A family cysteine protease
LWEPPTSVGALYTRNGAIAAPGVAQVVAALDAGRPAIVLMELSKSFFKPTSAGIVDAGSEEKPEHDRRHAVIAVGHGHVGSHLAVLVRNSWGVKWAQGGYAWVTERYLTPRIFNMALMA